jgi:hypothetical protein
MCGTAVSVGGGGAAGTTNLNLFTGFFLFLLLGFHWSRGFCPFVPPFNPFNLAAAAFASDLTCPPMRPSMTAAASFPSTFFLGIFPSLCGLSPFLSVVARLARDPALTPVVLNHV